MTDKQKTISPGASGLLAERDRRIAIVREQRKNAYGEIAKLSEKIRELEAQLVAIKALEPHYTLSRLDQYRQEAKFLKSTGRKQAADMLLEAANNITLLIDLDFMRNGEQECEDSS
jgi:hypothetical protein